MSSSFTRLLVIGLVWPEPDSSAAGGRMMQLLDLFLEEGWEVIFASAAAESEYASDLEEWGIREVNIEVNSDSFDDFIKKLQPDIVLFDRFMTEEQFGWRVAEHCPEALRILDTEDLHCLRRARRKAVEEGRPFSERDLLTEETAKREIASILRSDLSLVISEAEMELLTGLFGVEESLLHYLPFLLEPLDVGTASIRSSFEERQHFLTIGNFRHAPNRDAVYRLKKEIWPFVRRELPDADLNIYGAYPTPEIKALHQPGEGFYIKGRTEDAEAVVERARVLLAPLRFGAGLKGKLVEAMRCGTPSVTTGIGAEGIAGELEWGGSVADSPEAFSAAAVKLYADPQAWKKARDKGIRIINSRFSREEFGPDLIGRLTEIGGRLEDHRLEHFAGRMLMHHTMASTRYMSRWIEEKNRE